MAFLSTPPSRVATFQQIVLGMQISVSIHATLAGGDCAVRAAPGRTKRVSIHATLAGGDDCFALKQWEIYVSIHATLAGGDFNRSTLRKLSKVSIHATLAGGDTRKAT